MKISNETKIGALTVISVTILILGFQFLKGKTFFKGVKEYHSVYEEVSGLGKSSPVVINGLNVGKVSSMKMHPEKPEKIIVTYEIDDKVKVPLDTKARIISADLLGTKQIALELGDTNVYAANRDMIKGVSEESIEEKVDRIVAPIKIKAERLLGSIDSMVNIANHVFAENRTNIGKSMDNVQKALAALGGTAVKLDTLVAEESDRLQRIFVNFESITNNFKKNNEVITNVLQNISAISDSVKQSEITGTIARAQKAMEEFSHISEKINDGEGSLGMLLNNKELYTNLESSAQSLDELLSDLKENPDDYVNFNLIKIGGGKKNKKDKKKDKDESDELVKDKKHRHPNDLKSSAKH